MSVMIHLRYLLLTASIALLVTPASARWVGNSGVTAEIGFTDNLYLTEKDTESASFLNLRPFINYATSGTQASASIQYGPALLIYGNNSDLNDIRHVGVATGRFEFIKDVFAVRATAKANQNLVTPTNAATFNTFSNPDALTQTASFEIVPEIQLPLVNHKYATVRFEPGINFVYSADTAGGDRNSSRNGSRSRMSITSGRYFTRMPWSLDYSKNVFNSNTNDGWGRVNGRLGYVISSRYRLDFNLGYDNVDSGSGSNQSQQGLRWRLDFTWTPTERTLMTLGGGDASFGQDWLFRFKHRQKKTEWSADYRIIFATAAEEVLDQDVIPTVDAFGGQIQNPFTRAQGCSGVGGLNVGTPSLTSSVYQGDTFNARAGYRLGRSLLSLRVRADRRQYLNTGQDSFDGYGCLNISRSISRNASGSLSFDYWDHSDEYQGTDFSSDFSQQALRLTLQYRLGRRSTTAVSFNHTRREADIEGNSFDENMLRLIFSMQL